MKQFLSRHVRLLVLVCLCVSLVGVQAGAAEESGADTFVFKYEIGSPLRYAMSMTMDMKMIMNMNGQEMTQDMLMTMAYNVTLTPKEVLEDGSVALHLQPSDIAMDWDIKGAEGNVVMSLREGHVTGNVDGTVTIDTKNGVGVEQAEMLKKEMAAAYLSGYIDMDSLGHTVDIRGEPAFVEFWEEASASQVGFWGIVFPATSVGVGDTWTDGLVLEKLGQIRLDGEGMNVQIEFTRRPDETVEGRRVAVFAADSPFRFEGLTGTMELPGGEVPLEVLRLERTTRASARFDQARGELIDVDTTANADTAMRAKIEGVDLTIDLDLGLEMTVDKLPAQP